MEDAAMGMGVKTAVAPQGESRVVSNDAAGAPAPSSPDHSTTNVQKAGIDEPDIVKNDGNYIYYVNNTKKILYIIK